MVHIPETREMSMLNTPSVNDVELFAKGVAIFLQRMAETCVYIALILGVFAFVTIGTFMGTMNEARVAKDAEDPNMLCMKVGPYAHPCVPLDDLVGEIALHLRASIDDPARGPALRTCLVDFYFHGKNLTCVGGAFEDVMVGANDRVSLKRYLYRDNSYRVVRDGTQWTLQRRTDMMWYETYYFTVIAAIKSVGDSILHPTQGLSLFRKKCSP